MQSASSRIVTERPCGSIYPDKRVPRRGYWGRRRTGGLAEISLDDNPIGTLLGPKHIATIFNAYCAALMLGYSLNVRVTISWFMEYGSDVRRASKALSRFLKNYIQWCADQSNNKAEFDRPAYIFVHENPGGSRFHTHMMLEVDIDLMVRFRQWLTKYLAKNHRTRDPRFVRIRVRHPSDIRSQWIWLNYMCKGYDPAGGLFVSRGQRVYLGDIMMFYPEDPGAIDEVRRYGVSRVLHKKQYEQIVEGAFGVKCALPLDEQTQGKALDVKGLYEWRPLHPLIPAGKAQRNPEWLFSLR